MKATLWTANLIFDGKDKLIITSLTVLLWFITSFISLSNFWGKTELNRSF